MNQLVILCNSEQRALEDATALGLNNAQIFAATSVQLLKDIQLTDGLFTVSTDSPIEGIEMATILRGSKFIALPNCIKPLRDYIKSITNAVNVIIDSYQYTNHTEFSLRGFKDKVTEVFHSCNMTKVNGFDFEVLVNRSNQVKINPKSHKMEVIKTLMTGITLNKTVLDEFQGRIL